MDSGSRTAAVHYKYLRDIFEQLPETDEEKKTAENRHPGGVRLQLTRSVFSDGGDFFVASSN